MKKVVILTLAIVLCISVAVSAEGFKVSGGYLLGSHTASYDLMDSQTAGLVVAVEAPIAGPFGAMLNVITGQDSEYVILGVDIPDELIDASFNRCDILGSYVLPLEIDGVSVKALGGYSLTTSTLEIHDESDPVDQEDKTKGLVFGAAAELTPAEKLTFSGMFLASFGMKLDSEGVELDKKQTTVKVGAAYQVLKNVAVEGNYFSETSKVEGYVSETVSGFVFGARVSF